MTGTLLALGVALAGALGAMARFGIDTGLDRLLASRPSASRGRGRPFPWATLLINVSGSLLLGLLAGLAARQGVESPTVSTAFTVLGVGFCGGYTTFSTASVGTATMLREGRHLAAAGNAVGTLALTVAAAALGVWLASGR